MIAGLMILILAGILQGLFVLPLSFTRNWKWEHGWLMFSFWGMIVLNLILAFFLFPQVLSVYRLVPSHELVLLSLFGLCWGIGAVLFGLGMKKLGMSLGYPIIMGLIAGTGTLVPLILKEPASIFSLRGLGVILGCGLVILGILLCSRAAAERNQSQEINEKRTSLGAGILIAVFSGLLSALPNIGMSFATETIHQAVRAGVSPGMSGNLVWLLFFTIGFAANGAFTIYLMIRHHSIAEFKNSFSARNVLLTGVAAACWIGSFYLYGNAAGMLGSFGAIIAWPLFISIAILTGNLAGIWNGEWTNASLRSKGMLRSGMLIFLLAVLLISLSNYIMTL